MAALRTALAAAVLAAGMALAAPAAGQEQRDAERRLQEVRRELRDVAAERRRLEGRRGAAARALRDADERVAASAGALRRTESELEQGELALAELGARRGELQQRLAAQRRELGQLLRAAHAIGNHAALKLLLAQDRVGDANRALTYHRYLQRQRARRIGDLAGELAELDAVEQEIAARREALDRARERQRRQLAELERERAERAGTVTELERRHADRRARESALGRDARALERLMTQLREAAARAAAAERAAAARAGAGRDDGRRAPAQVARGAPIRVGGLGWPVSGTLLAGFGGRMPDGRASSGVLIGAAAGTPVQAVADGTVVFSEWMTGYGLIAIVDHGNGHMSLYAHNDALLRQVGDRVKRGDAVGSVGSSGGQGQPALYFELRRDGKPVDPATWLQKR
ncbi:peptidoglycan DD-metalloendopeptidase family protein [Luteimonas sp. RD2P54]|uniref:Peptidoglycan DD-metalloendopeptidase family protein n=1 Tax=Luteimonas endophytica TaxID=3042023 RepID=A0ABT6JCL3_9GAMM|nr:peptidoglycan DD-metalloendopeptidase family protein [Luteimonas endophytica]MDH5824552.1 peptidoglycan DD-metalloendopeptidase family protein [Luteimonas endophytica]